MHHMTTSQQQASTTDHPFCFRLKTWSSSIENWPVQDATGHSFCEQKKIGGSVSVLDNDRKKTAPRNGTPILPGGSGSVFENKTGWQTDWAAQVCRSRGPPAEARTKPPSIPYGTFAR